MIPQELSNKGECVSQLSEFRIFKYCLAFVLSFVSLFPLTVLSETKTLTVEGLYVKVFPHNELSDYYSQSLLRAEGKRKNASTEQFIKFDDIKSYETFIMLTDDISVEIPEQKFKYNSDDLELIIQFPRLAFQTFYSGVGYDYRNYRKISQIVTSAIRLAPYYESNNGEYIYKIV